MQVVWFKRDLRIRDHRSLTAACRSGQPVLCLYIFEPELWRQPDADARHLHFINQSLRELRSRIQEVGGQLVIRVGEVVDVLTEIHQQQAIDVVHSHEETGTLWTFERDKAMARWCVSSGVKWVEQTQNGVIRRMKNRGGWASKWYRRMNEPLQRSPAKILAARDFATADLPMPERLGLTGLADPALIQIGGETAAHQTLKSFLKERGQNYHQEMSSPLTAWDSCSRLSPHLAWGTISLPYLYQSLQRQIRSQQQRRSGTPEDRRRRLTALKAFDERLHWHCHFIQKLEDQPDLEDVNMHRACDGLRPEELKKPYFDAWTEGRTGYPLVDACMRSVRATGWLNFRMRAMVVSFASYHLWLDWRPTSRWLARMFTDYEPGIHYNQFQMQSGTTGISTVRIYNPIKQIADHDPEGKYIRRWVPELAKIPTQHIAEPHRMPTSLQQKIDCVIGTDYPVPIVDHQKAYALAHERMKRLRGKESARTEAQDILARHGSRRGPK